MAHAILQQRLIGGIAAILLLTFTVLAVLVFLGMAAAVANAWRRLRAERRYDYGPHASRLWMELDAHLNEYVAANADLDAGFARLNTAIRNQQLEGEQ